MHIATYSNQAISGRRCVSQLSTSLGQNFLKFAGWPSQLDCRTSRDQAEQSQLLALYCDVSGGFLRLYSFCTVCLSVGRFVVLTSSLVLRRSIVTPVVVVYESLGSEYLLLAASLAR
jgi:hypothetical protein